VPVKEVLASYAVMDCAPAMNAGPEIARRLVQVIADTVEVRSIMLDNSAAPSITTPLRSMRWPPRHEGVCGRGQPAQPAPKLKADKGHDAGRQTVRDFVPPLPATLAFKIREPVEQTRARHKHSDRSTSNFHAQSTVTAFPLQPGQAGRRLRPNYSASSQR
jgi:hypothetical protein